MKIASTTLTGNSADVIADALRSVVDWVDYCLIIDTGVTDRTLEIAREVVGDKYVSRRFAWVQDFAAARNFALDAAAELGADWAITLDTDERIQRRGVDLRAVMANATAGVLMMSSADGSYAKERCFRLPARERFSGPTHESFPGYAVGAITVEHACFEELAKSPEALRRKFERDLEILKRHVRAHPSDPRWQFYLGETLKNLNRPAEAVLAYDACAALRGWNEESAWACYRAAECLSTLGRFRDAIDRCATGLARHAGIAELAWLAGFCAYRLDDFAQAVYWSRIAAAQGLYQGTGAAVPRIGFRNLEALYEGPFDVLRFALLKLGDVPGASAAEAEYARARDARLVRGV
ncbi:MAG TPA: glycosyltransferase [Polyangiaceae bacterium]|nr:glycosyltransferase [Polyangiaceae bacterium]